MAERRVRQTDTVNVAKLTFPLQLVIVIMASVLSAVGSVWAIQAGLRSDVRNLSTQMAGQVETAKVQRQLDVSEAARHVEGLKRATDELKATVDAIKAEQRLMGIEMQNFREAVLTMQGRKEP